MGEVDKMINEKLHLLTASGNNSKIRKPEYVIDLVNSSLFKDSINKDIVLKCLDSTFSSLPLDWDADFIGNWV